MWWVCDCRSHWNGCMLVIILCYHEHREMQICLPRDAAKCFVMAAWILYGLCFGEEAGARNLVSFRVKWLQPAMKGTSCVRRLRLGSFLPRMRSSSVFCNEWLFLRTYIILCVCWICGCGSHWNDCMIVVIWWCPVRRSIQVCDVIRRNTL